MCRMRRFLTVMLAVALAAAMLALSAAAEAEERADGSASSSFLSGSLLASDGETVPYDNSGVVMDLSGQGHGNSYFVTLEHTDRIDANALRFVIANDSAASYVTLRLSYMTEDKRTGSETYRMELSPFSGQMVYVLRSPYAPFLLDMTMTFPALSDGQVTFFGAEPVEVYDEPTFSNGNLISCIYRDDNKTVTLKGTVYHDVMIHAAGGTLGLFRLESGQTLEELMADATARPVTSAALSISFELLAPATDIQSRFCAYAVMICLPDGTRLPVGEAKYPRGSEETFALTLKEGSYFKGVDTSMTAGAVDVNPGSAIVDVYLNRLENVQHIGHLYTVEDHYFYFDRSYVAELDDEIRSLSSAECAVYLRFLAEDDGNGNGDGTDMPFAGGVGQDGYLPLRGDSREAVMYLYAYTSFLCERYQSAEKGRIAGIIVGQGINGYRGMSPDELTRSYGQALTVIADTVRGISHELAVVVPVTDRWTEPLLGEGVSAPLFLESLSYYLQKHSGFPFCVMLEGGHNPYRLNNDYLRFLAAQEGGAVPDPGAANTTLIPAGLLSSYVCSENIGLLDGFLSYYSSLYGGLCDKFLYHWTPEPGTTGEALTASLVYHCYRLAHDPAVAAFFVSFRQYEAEGDFTELSKVRYLLKYVDTAESLQRTEFALRIFGISYWGELFDSFDIGEVVRTGLSEVVLLEQTEETFSGHYTLFDFPASNSPRGWAAGNHCEALSVGIHGDWGKTLEAVMLSDLSESGEYADIAYYFENGEFLEDAPFVGLSLGVECTQTPGAVFEVKVVIGTAGNCVEARRTVNSGQLYSLVLADEGIEKMTYMRISVKPVMGTPATFSLHVRDISLESAVYDSQTLNTLYSARHRMAQGTEQDGQEEQPRYLAAVLLGICALVMTGVILVWLSRLGRVQNQRDENTK